MQAALKRLHSPDITDLQTYVPEDDERFGFLLQMIVGPANGDGAESFDVFVCTHKWLLEKHAGSDVLVGLHKLIVFEYDYRRLWQFIEKYLMHCSGDTWKEIAQKVGLLGHWEFEGYQSNP